MTKVKTKRKAAKKVDAALPKMDVNIKQAWLSALRGGEFEPCFGKLSIVLDDGSRLFDPIGVLCNLHAEQHPAFAATQTNPSDYPVHVVAEWAGVGGREDDQGRYVVPYYAVLMYHNQWQEPDFVRIAKWIEENL